ncbi:MAG: O-antigen ligase family protein, partial [Blastocatellia bacterium]
LLFHLSARPRMLALQIGLMLPAIYLLVRSGARGPLVSFVVTLIAYVVWLGGLRPRFRWSILAVLAVVLIGSFRLIPDITSSFYQALVDPTQTPSADPSANSIQERMLLIDTAIREFLEHPVIGVGTGNSSGGTGYPHNSFVEVAAEFGLVGLVVFVSLCGLIVQTAIRHLRGFSTASALGRRDWMMNLAFCCFIFAFVEGLFSAYMGGDMLFYVSASLVSVVAKLTEREKQGEWEERRIRYYEQRGEQWGQAPLA